LFNEADNPNLLYGIAQHGHNSLKSAVIQMSDTSAAYGGRTTLISPAINLNGLTLPAFSFKYAFSQKVLNSNDKLDVFISNDCGKTWLSKGSRIGANLRTVTTAQADKNWAPQDSTQWKEYTFLVTNAYAVDNFMFKIELTTYRGNAFFIDNINVNPAGYNSIQKLALEGVELLPNPANSFIQINGLPEKMEYIISDITGKPCIQGFIDDAQTIGVAILPAGIYNVSLQGPNSFCNKRFVKY
jgi:hypothetical protein